MDFRFVRDDQTEDAPMKGYDLHQGSSTIVNNITLSHALPVGYLGSNLSPVLALFHKGIGDYIIMSSHEM